uniref:Uncharacterized protein n=1 Tax=Strombidium rassoulzadegani TaxID=1082188 RepID=A0A7S3CNA2_9SPIT
MLRHVKHAHFQVAEPSSIVSLDQRRHGFLGPRQFLFNDLGGVFDSVVVLLDLGVGEGEVEADGDLHLLNQLRGLLLTSDHVVLLILEKHLECEEGLVVERDGDPVGPANLLRVVIFPH